MQLIPEPGPLRILSIASLVNTLGNGLFYTSAALFYTRSIGLSPGQVGAGLTASGLLALLVGIPAGHLADLRGAREVLVVLLVLDAAAMASFALVNGFVGFLASATAYLCVDKAASAVRQGLIASAFPPEGRVRGRAYLRSVTNLGIGVGSALAGVAIAADTREAYVALVLADALTYLGCALVISRLPRREGGVRKAEKGGMTLALRDKPYVVVSAVSAVLGLHYVLLEIAVPLWVDRYTSAPRWTVALLFLVNTSCCVLLQVRMAKGSHDVPSSSRAQRLGGLLIAASCAAFAASDHGSAAVAVSVLVVATLVNVAGELQQASGSWGLGFGLAPEHAQGQYQGLYSTGVAASQMLGPLVVTATVVAWGTPGWLVLGAVFALAGIATVPVVAWAERSRQLAKT